MHFTLYFYFSISSVLLKKFKPPFYLSSPLISATSAARATPSVLGQLYLPRTLALVLAHASIPQQAAASLFA
jgi:hypothetical protein